MTERLVVGVFGGLGAMLSPVARHWSLQAAARVATVHDRGLDGELRQERRAEWLRHGAKLVGAVEQVLDPVDLDGVFVCCGKNGDDLLLIAQIANLLGLKPKRQFICHMSTVTPGFALAATEFCDSIGVDYVNYPLTGGPLGAQNGTMLILASGKHELFTRLSPCLARLGSPRYFGAAPEAAAEVKLIGHAMVFNGLIGICSAAALHAECFQGGVIGGADQAAFFDFLNAGGGGTRQWEVALGHGVKRDVWGSGFLITHAVIDAIYTAALLHERGTSRLAVRPLLELALAFSFVLNCVGGDLATHSVVRELVASRARELDAFVAKHLVLDGELDRAILSCIDSLPEALRPKVALGVSVSDFSVFSKSPCQ